jgi:ABC-2 type transport system ATP-binding protein
MDPIIIAGLTKTYGDFTAARDVTFSVPAGSICGLLGPNGAGKSTTLKCAVGLARPTAGRVEFFGAPLAPKAFERIAFVPEKPALYDGFSANDHLEVMRRSHKRYDDKRARKMLEIFGFDPKKKVRKLSKGQRTAMGLVLAFSFRPEVMILDEPASGLDPLLQRAILDLLIEAATQGAAIVLSSHQIGHVERAADCVVIMRKGLVVLEGEIETLRERERLIEAVFAGPYDGAEFERDPRVRFVDRRGRTLRLHVHADHDAVAREVEALGPTSITVFNQNLEDLFFAAVEEPRPVTLEAD